MRWREAYRAYSIAPAEKGDVKSSEGFGAAGVPGCTESGALGSFRRVGERKGELKERR